MMLKINDIFESISGESGGGIKQGAWCTFIRLQGCNLRCAWCDTVRSQCMQEGKEMFTSEIISIVHKLGNKNILITGGEPLFQTNIIHIIEYLTSVNYTVQIETNGSITPPFLPKVHWVMDYKCPSSGMTDKMFFRDFRFSYYLKALLHYQESKGGTVCIKYVVVDNIDLNFAIRSILELLDDEVIIPYLISPVNASSDMITDIMNKIKEQKIKKKNILDYIIFSSQLHKIYNLL